jgi:hypothetical protein
MFEPRPRNTAPREAEYVRGSSAEQPAARGITHKLAFYNVGWQATDKKHNAAWLAREIKEIVSQKNVDAIGISEVFNQKDNHLKDRRENIMLELLRELNQRSAERPAWEGRTGVHKIFLWNSRRLRLLDYEVVSCGIQEHPWRKSQYFQLQAKGSDFPLHVYHNHSPTTNLTLGRKKTHSQKSIGSCDRQEQCCTTCRSLRRRFQL